MQAKVHTQDIDAATIPPLAQPSVTRRGNWNGRSHTQRGGITLVVAPCVHYAGQAVAGVGGHIEMPLSVTCRTPKFAERSDVKNW